MSFKSSLQRDLDRFSKVINSSDFNIREVTKGALSQARSKLNAWAFRRLNEVAVETFYNHAPYDVWYGMRVLSVDGTRLMLPNHKTVKEEFGVHGFGPNADSCRSMATASILYDVINHISIDAEIAPYSTSERDLLMLHLEKVKKGDLLLLDRGYPSFWLLFLLNAKGIEFCVRHKSTWWKKVKAFTSSEEDDCIVQFTLPKKHRDKLKDYPELIDKELSFRLVKVTLDNGEVEILCTSLLDSIKYDKEEMKRLYHYRWNEEETYKLLKSRAELEKFSGKTAKAIKQDFHAKVFMLTMCAAHAHPIEEKVVEEYKRDKDKKHSQKINRTHALATMMDMLIPMFIKKKIKQALIAFDDLVYNTREIIRPGRNNPRKKRPKKQHHMNYKPL